MSAHYEKWLWIELIGFDNRQKDFGVKAFLEKAGFVPGGVSLFLCDPAFIHEHQGVDRARKLPPGDCSYHAHPYNDERRRQAWTNLQVKGLVAELQRHGVKVYFNVFDSPGDKWREKYPNLCYTNRAGARGYALCPWKRMDKNVFYEDFLVAKLRRVMRDYNFDGYHLADGYAHPRIPVYDGDWSDDMVAQFLAAAGISLPPSIPRACAENQAKLRRRADWIWNNRRKEWIFFHVQRITSFIAKVAAALHAENKKLIANSAWTRDPFESIYRYGADYRKMAAAGIDAFVVEAAAAIMDIDNDEKWGPRKSRYLNNFMAAFMLNKACAPHKPMFYLNGIKDFHENWNVLRHAPTTLESEIYSLSNMYWLDAQGLPRRCASGPFVCLADSIKREEWQWLNERWRLAYDLNPRRVLGATLVWSERALENQLDDFINTRRWTTHRLLHHLLGLGAPLYAVAGINNLAKVRGTIVALNAHLYPPEEIRKIMAYKKGAVILIGGKTTLPRRPAIRFADAYPPDQLCCCYYGKKLEIGGKIKPDSREKIPGNLVKIKDPLYFPQELYFRAVSDSFLQKCADLITKCGDGAYVPRKAPSAFVWADKGGYKYARILTLDAGNGTSRLFIRNDKYVYVTALIDVGRRISKIKIISPFPHVPIRPNGSVFQAKIPGRGMIVLDVST